MLYALQQAQENQSFLFPPNQHRSLPLQLCIIVYCGAVFSSLSCFFKGEKHGAPVRRDFSHMVQKCKRPWQNLVLTRPLFPCPICAQRRPRITKSSGSCSRARLGTCQNAPRGFLPSHGLPPTMAAFRRKATQLQIQLRGKPRTPTGFLLSPRHAAQQQRGR